MFPSALTTSSGGGLGTVGTMRFREVDQKGLGEWKAFLLHGPDCLRVFMQIT